MVACVGGWAWTAGVDVAGVGKVAAEVARCMADWMGGVGG